VTAGKRVHGTGAIPGGVNKALTAQERAYLQEDVYRAIAWSREAVEVSAGCTRATASTTTPSAPSARACCRSSRPTARSTCTTAACGRATPTGGSWSTAATAAAYWELIFEK